MTLEGRLEWRKKCAQSNISIDDMLGITRAVLEALIKHAEEKEARYIGMDSFSESAGLRHTLRHIPESLADVKRIDKEGLTEMLECE